MGTAYSALKARVLRTFIRDDKTTEIEEAINDAYAEMIAAVGPRKLQDQVYKTLVIGREEYPLPSTLLSLRHPIRLIDPTSATSATSSYPLRHLNKSEYDYWEPNPNASSPSTGRPWGYCIYKNSILITDIPDKAYTIELNMGGEPTKLVNETDESIFSWVWDEIIASGALSRLFVITKQFDYAKAHRDIYNNGYLDGEGNLVGGLKLLKRLERDNQDAPLIVENNRL